MAMDWNSDDPVGFQDWNFITMFYQAVRERAWATNNQFPRCTDVWMAGSYANGVHTPCTVTAITPTSVTLDNMSLQDTGNVDNIIRAINGLPFDPPNVVFPRSFALILWHNNYLQPHRILRGHCSGWDAATDTMTMTWSNPWRLRYGPDGLDQFIGKEVVLIADSTTYWPWWHERQPERPSDFPTLSGECVTRGPFTVTEVDVDDETGEVWFAVASHTFRVGNDAKITGGPLAGQTQEVMELAEEQTKRWIRLESPGTWEEPYPVGWSLKHVANVLPFTQDWGPVPTDPATELPGKHVVWNSNRWVITGLTGTGWLTLRLESGETELPLNAPGYVAIIEADGYWSEKHKPRAYMGYTGLHQSSDYTVLHNDTYRGYFPGSFWTPVYTMQINLGGGPIWLDIKDNDVWVPYTLDQSSPERCLTKDVTKSVRCLQMAIDGLSYSFVPMWDYQGKKSIPNMGVRMFVDAGISGSRESLSLTWQDYGNYWLIGVLAECPVPEWYKPEMGALRYLIVCNTLSDKPVQSGTVSPSEDGKFHFAFEAFYEYRQANDDGTSGEHYVWWGNSTEPVGDYSVFLTPTWTRECPAEFRYMYSKTCLLPAVETDEWGVAHVVTPQDHGQKCGGFSKREKSTTYTENGTFKVGETARYVGDNIWWPPTMMIAGSYAQNPDNLYRAKYYTGKPETWQSPAMTSGTIDEFGEFYVRDMGQQWHIEGDRFAHTATATAGSTTSFTAGDKVPVVYDSNYNRISGSAFWGELDMLQQPRFVDFIAEVTLYDDEDQIIGTYYRVVRNHNCGTATVSWNEPLPFPLREGDQIVLREPMYELNRWQERALVLKFPACDVPREGGGDPIHFDAVEDRHVTITHNDSSRLFFTPAVDDVEWSREADGVTYTRTGATYTIIERMPGTVWKWDGSKWVVPDYPDQLGAAVTRLLRWGPVNNWTYLDTKMSLNPFQQMKLALNKLQWTLGGAAIQPYSDHAHTVRGIIETIPNSNGRFFQPAMRGTIDPDGDAEAAAAWLLNPGNAPWWTSMTGPYDYVHYTSSMAISLAGIDFDTVIAWNYPGGGATHYPWGVCVVQRNVTWGWEGGYPHTTGENPTGIALLGGSVELFCLCDRAVHWHATPFNPNNASYVEYLGPEHTYQAVGGGSADYDVHGGLILPPAPDLPPPINISMLPNEWFGWSDEPWPYPTQPDGSVTPPGYPWEPSAVESWTGSVVAIWKWSMEYVLDPSP